MDFQILIEILYISIIIATRTIEKIKNRSNQSSGIPSKASPRAWRSTQTSPGSIERIEQMKIEKVTLNEPNIFYKKEEK